MPKNDLPKPSHAAHDNDPRAPEVPEEKVFDYLLAAVDEDAVDQVLEISERLTVDQVLATLFYAASIYLRQAVPDEETACDKHRGLQRFSHQALHSFFEIEMEDADGED